MSDRPVAHAGQRRDGRVAVAAVDQPVVDLVADDDQVVAHGDVGEGARASSVVKYRAGGIARVAQEQHLGARRDGRLERLWVQLEVRLGRGRDENRHAAVEHDRGQVGDVRRLVQDDLVARVDERGHGRGHRLRRANRDADLVVGVVGDAVQALQVRRQGAPQLDRAVVAGVVRAAAAQRADALLDDLRRAS